MFKKMMIYFATITLSLWGIARVMNKMFYADNVKLYTCVVFAIIFIIVTLIRASSNDSPKYPFIYYEYEDGAENIVENEIIAGKYRRLNVAYYVEFYALSASAALMLTFGHGFGQGLGALALLAVGICHIIRGNYDKMYR